MPKQPIEVVIETTNNTENNNNQQQPEEQQQHQEKPNATTNTITSDDILAPVTTKIDEDKETNIDKNDEEYENDPTLLRPYKRVNSEPIIKRVTELRQLVRTIQSHGNNSLLFTNEIRKELDDHIDNLKYVAIAENHFPNRPSVLAEKETGVIPLMLEMTLSLRFSVVYGAIDFLALATKHPLCAIEVLSATDDALVKKSKEGEEEKQKDEHDELNLKPSVATLNLIARAMMKYKNKNELQLSSLDLLQNLVFATTTATTSSSISAASNKNNNNNEFVFPTLDILQSQAMSTVINCVSEAQQKHNSLDPQFNTMIAEKVCRYFQLLVHQRPSLSASSSSTNNKISDNHHQEQEGEPSVADIFANVGDVLPTILRLGSQYYTRPKVAGPVCRILSHMAYNSHEALALWSSPRSLPSITPPTLISKILKHYAPTSLHSVILDCIRALSQMANHYMPLQINSLVLLIRGVMTENGNVEVLTTCIACFAHLLRMCEKEFDEVFESKETDADQKERARKDMKLFLETLQKEAIPFVGAAYDHFAEDSEDLEMVADAFLRSLGDRIRKFYYTVLPRQQE